MSLTEHDAALGTKKRVTLAELRPGDVVQFRYKGEERYVLVLEPNADGLMHTMDLALLNRASVLRLKDQLRKNTSRNVYESYIKLQKQFREANAYRKFSITEIEEMFRIDYKTRLY